jgi:hypothetical protein
MVPAKQNASSGVLYRWYHALNYTSVYLIKFSDKKVAGLLRFDCTCIASDREIRLIQVRLYEV